MKSTLIKETDKLFNGIKLKLNINLLGFEKVNIIGLILFTLVLLFSIFISCAQANGSEMKEMKIIYVHGFGERRFPPAFEKKMKAFLAPLDGNYEVETFRWNSLKLDLTKVMDQWQDAKINADSEAKRFAIEVIEKCEKEETPYVFIGYSLGSKVIAESLKYPDSELKYLRGIYFLGSALPTDYQLDSKILPKDFKIINYYSDYLDTVLGLSYYVAEGTKAGGEVGFDDEKNFINLRTVCTHVYKGGPLQRDYSNLAEAIGYLSLFKEGIFLNEGEPNFNLEWSVASGMVNWNNILELKEGSKIYLIQQHVNTGYYRLLSVDEQGKRTRKGWGRNLHTLLEELKPENQSFIKNF